MGTCWCQIGRVWQAWQHFPTMCLNGFLCHIGHMRVGNVMQQKSSMLPIRSFILNSHVELFHLLNIEFCIFHLVPFKEILRDNPFPVPPYAQHRFMWNKILLHAWCQLFTRAKPFLALHHIDVQTPFEPLIRETPYVRSVKCWEKLKKCCGSSKFYLETLYLQLSNYLSSNK